MRLSYPTACVADMVKGGFLPVNAPDEVHKFLTDNQGRFEIGMQPVEHYVRQNKLTVRPETLDQIKRLQRVFQITQSDQAMSGLLKHDVHAAYHVVRYQKEAFVSKFADEVEGSGPPGRSTNDRSRSTTWSSTSRSAT